MGVPALTLDNDRTLLHQALMANAAGHPNDEPLARILSSWACGVGVLPACLGLHPPELDALLAHHFPGFPARRFDRIRCQQVIAEERLPELHELVLLMLHDRALGDRSEGWVAQILAAGCLGGDHLWQDLGLWCRGDLSRLIVDNFPALAARNHRDMKWKRFFYKQLCEREGIHTCRAPSCEECADYPACFGPEEQPAVSL